MSSSRPTLQAIWEELKDQRRLFDGMQKDVSQIKQDVQTLSPQSRLAHPIPRPIRGIDYNRTISVATYLREKINEHNAQCNECKYLEFPGPEQTTDKQLNSNAIASIESLLKVKLDGAFGVRTWEKVQSDPALSKKAELVVLAASKMDDLAVFAQAQGQWAIRMLAAAKMKSKMRANGKGQEGENEDDEEDDSNNQNGDATRGGGTGSQVIHRSANRVLISGRSRT